VSYILKNVPTFKNEDDKTDISVDTYTKICLIFEKQEFISISKWYFVVNQTQYSKSCNFANDNCVFWETSVILKKKSMFCTASKCNYKSQKKKMKKKSIINDL